MAMSDLKIFSMLKQRMSYLSKRQSVIARNIANIDTPGYKPQALKKVDFSKMATEATKKIDMKITNPKHIRSSIGSGGKFSTIAEKDIYETKPNGNQVNLNQELMKMSKNSLDYKTTTGIYRKMSEMMRNAISGGR